MDQRPGQLNEEDRFEDRSTMSRVDDEAMAAADTVDDYNGETERIKADIEDTRAELGQTLNEIQERLSPEHVMDQVKETVREATIGKVERVMEKVNETISNVTEPAMDAMGYAGEKLKETGSMVTNTVRQNPIPLALIGLGLGMFIVNRVRSADDRTRRSGLYQPDRELGYGDAGYQYGGKSRQYATRSGEYAGTSRPYGAPDRTSLSGVRETASEFAQGTADKVSELSQQAREGARWAGRGFERLVRENPLAVGATAIAVGAAVGLALPATRVEHEYMGEASEKIVDKAQQVARDAMDKVKTAAQGATGGQTMQPGQSQPGQSQPGQPRPSQSQPGQSQQNQSQQNQQQGQSQQGQSRPGQSQPGQPTPTP